MNDILWTSAASLWSERIGSDLSGLGQPTILRFANDSFMDEFANILTNQPARLADFRAWPETWREPLPQPASVAVLPPALREFQRKRLGLTAGPKAVDYSDAAKPLKLYQPAHQRYYLLTSSLVCRQVGLPDHAMNTSAQEKASFVIRRLMLAKPESFANSVPPAPDQAAPGVYDEFAFVSGEWQKVLDGKLLADGEELNPLFAVCYTQTDARRRRLFGGLIPVGKREAYMMAKKTAPAAVVPGGADPRLEALLNRVFFGPCDSLIESAINTASKMNTDLATAKVADINDIKARQANDIKNMRRQIQEASWYLLLDLAGFLDQHMKPVLTALESGAAATGTPALDKALKALNRIVLPKKMKAALEAENPGATVKSSLGDALGKIRAYRKQLDETVVEPYKGADLGTVWPNFLFPFADMLSQDVPAPARVKLNMPRKLANDAVPDDTAYETVVENSPLAGEELRSAFGAKVMTLLDELRAALLAALPAQSALRLPPVPLAGQISKTMASTPITETGWFVARCALERPNCFPLPDAVVSDPTPAFQLAGFFDPDAPARPIRIALPVDTSPAGLRKFDKNTAFIMSDMLCGQVERAKSMGLIDLIRSVLPFPLHKDLDMDSAPCKEGSDALGTICSLSIPIITICALILLIIIVNLLDIIFHWIPFFIMCFPLPKFSAKKASV